MAHNGNDFRAAGPAEGGRPAIGLFESAWRHVVALAAVVVLAAIGGYLVSSSQAPEYEATTVLVYSDSTNSPSDQSGLPVQDPGRYLATQADLVVSDQVVDATARAVDDGTTADYVSTHVWAVPSELSNTLTITASAADPARASRLANAAATAYLAVLREQARASAAAAAQALQRQYDDVQRQIDRLVRQRPPVVGAIETMAALRERLSDIAVEQSRLRAAALTYQPAVRVTHPAEPPQDPVSPVPLRDAGLAALIALLVGAVVAWAFETRSQSRSDPGRVARLLGAACLGRVPAVGAEPNSSTGYASLDGAWQQVVSAVDASLRRMGAQSLLVASTTSSEQGGFAAARLAISTAADGRSVILIDADHARRELSMLAGADAVPGLTELVEQNGCIRHNDSAGSRGMSTVDLVAVGRSVPNSAAFYRSERFRSTVASVQRDADLIVIAGPPVLEGPDAAVLADSADAVLLVVPDTAADAELQEIVSRLSWSRARLAGYLVLEPGRRKRRFWRRRPWQRRSAAAPDEAGSGQARGPSWIADYLSPALVVFRGVATRPNGRLPIVSPERGL